MTSPANSTVQNILPVQALFDVQNNFQTFIGQGKPFYATVNPAQSNLSITNSTIDSTTIGATTPSTGVFTNIQTTTGQVLDAPVNADDIVNLFTLQAYSAGLYWKAPVQVATTANITLSGLQTIDGYTTLANDRVLVKNQSNAANNGIYVASSGAWTRAADMNTWSEVVSAITFVENGTSQIGTGWYSTAQNGGTLGVTPINFSSFTLSAPYTAGTGLNLTGYQFSLANTSVTAGTYGSASQTLSLAVNAQGQLTSANATAIAIAASQITSGTIASSLISGNYANITGVGTITSGTWQGSPITNAYLANSTITVNGISIALGNSGTITANTPNSVTFDNSGSGSLSGVTFNGSAAKTISYNTIGAPSTTGTNASGTWGISITGSAASANTSTTATTATNLAGGSSYAIPYQSGSGSTTFLSAGSSGTLLMTLGNVTAPIWVSPSSLTVGAANNISGGSSGSLAYQSASSTTSFLGLGTTGYVLTAGASAPQYVAQSTLSVGTATNLAGGSAGYIPYQSAANITSFLTTGSIGQVLTSNGSGAPTWSTPASSITLSDDTTTNATRYPLFANATSGTISTEFTSSTKYQFNPSTGVLTATGFSGNGSALTSLTAGNLTGTIPSGVLGNSTVYIGTTAIALNRASASQTLTGTSIDGNAGTANSATTATNTTNVAVTDNTSTNSTFYPTFVSATTGNVGVTTSSTKLQYNPSTGVYTAPSYTGGSYIANGSTTGNVAAGVFSYGTLNYTDVNIVASYAGNVNSYYQMILQNLNSGNAASADFIVSNSVSNATSSYGDFGINSGSFAGSGSLQLANATYVYSAGGDLVLGTQTSNSIHMVVGNSTTDAMTINTSGAVAFNGSYGTSGYVLQTNGSGSAPSWVAPSGGGISWQSVQTSNFTASSGNAYPINTTSGAITVTLPASPSAGNMIILTDYAGTWATNNLTIAVNGNKLDGKTINGVLSTNRQSVSLVYIDSTQGWIVYSGFLDSLPVQTYSVSYLLVAGGGTGAGDRAGGGGAGGLIAGTFQATAGTVYTAVIGAGASYYGSVNGGNSTLTGVTTAIGGGRGGQPGAFSGSSGGSGGGDYANNGSPGAGTSGQGYSGGSGGGNVGGGGGGAGGAGVAGPTASGGAGYTWIDGNTYAGGGGGGGNNTTGGSGGSGGGGNGQSGNGPAGTAGAVNTGGGGGGGGGISGSVSGVGAGGGSGVCILRVLTSVYSGITTGSPTITTSGSYTYIKFTSSGSYTA